MHHFLGIDGCPAGWVGASITYNNDTPVSCEWLRFHTFAAVLQAQPKFLQIAVDMPIGLLDEHRKGGRVCDQAARKAISPRHSSVFSAPPRPALYAETYDEARPYGLSKQAFNICKKIREIDDLLTPELQERVFEAHPELAFTRLAGHPMTHNKKGSPGRAERIAALTRVFPHAQAWLAAIPFLRKQVARDDAIDALALAHVAFTKHHGQALCLPEEPTRDSKGLAMVIWG